MRLVYLICITLFMPWGNVHAENLSPMDDRDELLSRMKTALAPLFQENQDYTLGEVNVAGEGSGFKLSAKATFYQISSVNVIGTFASLDQFSRLELSFPPDSKLPATAQQKLAKQNFVDWIPSEMRNLVVLKSMYVEFSGASISTVGIQFAGKQSWKPVQGISAENITVDFNLNTPTGAISISSTLKSNLVLGEATIDISATLSSKPEDCVLKGDLSNLSMGGILGTIGVQKAPEWPDAVWNLKLSTGSIAIAPFAKTLSLYGSTDFGEIEFYINASATPTAFMVGISPPSDFSFTKLSPDLGVIDKMGLKNTAIVLSSATQKTRLQLFKKLGQETEVTRGLTLLSLYNISEVSREVEKLIGKSQLLLKATLSTNPADIKLMAMLDASIPFDEKRSVVLTKVVFTLAPDPANFKISLGGDLEVMAEKKKLFFTSSVALNLSNLELSVAGIMKGTWDRPFDYQGLQLSDLGLSVGLSFKSMPIPVPTLQMMGKIKVGNPASPAFAGDITLAIDPTNPVNCMIDGGFKQILLKDLVAATCPKVKIPDHLKTTVNTMAISDARLTIVPGLSEVTVLEKRYSPGFLIKGKTRVDEYDVELLLSVSDQGIEAGASMSALEYPPYFAFTGAREKPNPYFYLALNLKDPKFAISGKAAVMKVIAEADILLKDKGFDLYMYGKIFNMFQAKLQIAAGSLKDGPGFMVKATMESDLHKYISDIASAEIDRSTKESQKSFREAQATLTQKQKEVATLNAEIDKQRAIVKTERDKDCEVFNNAKAKVSKDRKKVNDLNDDIDAKESKIKKLAKAMDEDKLKIPENSAKIAQLKTEIGALELSLATAKTTLKASEKALELLGQGCDLTPIDLDPRVSGLIASRETANKSLQAAKAIVEGTGTITLGTLKATKYIVEKGNAGVVTITAASFETKLSIADGGMVSLKVKGTYAGDPMERTFTINLISPQATVEAFARELLK